MTKTTTTLITFTDLNNERCIERVSTELAKLLIANDTNFAYATVRQVHEALKGEAGTMLAKKHLGDKI